MTDQVEAVPNIDDVQAAIRELFAPGQVIELRGLGVTDGATPKKFTLFGFYDDYEKLALDAVKMSNAPGIFGTYFTLQKIKPALLQRSPNKYRRAGKDDCTSDADVTDYRWLPIDLDPVRPVGISSTDAEKLEAHAVALRAVEFLKSLGVDTVQGDSGNGYHILARLDLPTSEKALVQRVVAAIAERFTTDAVSVDLTVFNPARIWKVYGSVARKGFSSVERPHRVAKILQRLPEDAAEPVSRELLETIAADIPAEPDKKTGKKVSDHDMAWGVEKVEEFMDACHVKHGGHVEYRGGYKWLLDVCPFNAEHTRPSIIVTIADSGAVGFRCLHNSCFTKKWKDFRDYGEGVIGHKFEFKETAAAVDPEAIVCGPGLLTDMVSRTEMVLHSLGLKYFERHGDLVNVCYGREAEDLKDVDRDGDSVIIQSASAASILRDLDQKAKYVKRVNTKDGPVDIRLEVPGTMPTQVHDRVRSQPRSVPFESLMMVTGSPVLLRSGKVHDYQTNFEEGVMYVNAHTDYYPPVPEHPTKEMAVAALEQFYPVFSKFPFVDPEKMNERRKTASYAVVLSGALSLMARPYMGIGAIPIHGVTAHAPRSGKTKIVEAATAAALGHRPTSIHYSGEEELDKHLLPLMVAGDRAILIDNVERSLESSKLCVLVTTGTMHDRVLGKSENVLLKNYAVLWTTGNNLIIGGDLTARAVRCDIDPNEEFPESRTFDFDPVHRAQDRHPQLVAAGLTMLRAYIVAGMPWTLKRAPWGGFVRWDKLICGCLTWLGMADPYETRSRIISDDPVRAANLDILEVWYAEYRDNVVSFRKMQKDRGEVYNILLKGTEWNGYHARWLLSRLLGKTVGGLTLIRIQGRTSEYQVVGAYKQVIPDDPPPEDDKIPF